MRVTQGRTRFSSGLDRGIPQCIQRERENTPYKGPGSGIYYLKAEKPDAGYFRECSIKTEKLSGITYGHPVMSCFKSDTDSNDDFPSSTQVGMLTAHGAQAGDTGS